MRSGGGGTRVACGVAADEFGAGFTDEIPVATQVAAHVHGRAELGETIGFERLDDLGVEMQLFRGRRDRQAGTFATRAQPFADRTRRWLESRWRPSRPS